MQQQSIVSMVEKLRTRAGFILAASALFGGLVLPASAFADELQPLPAPSLSSPAPSDASFCSVLQNYDASATYVFSTDGNDTASGYLWQYNNQNFVCASDVYEGQLVTLYVTVSRVGFSSSSASVSGVSLMTPPEIPYTNYVRTSDSFTFEFAPQTAVDETRQLYTYAGQIRYLDATHIQVYGLTAGASTECGIYVVRPGYYTASWPFVGSALEAQVTPVDQTPDSNLPAPSSLDSSEARDREASIAAEAARRAALQAAVTAYILEKETLKAKALEDQRRVEAEKLAADSAAIARIVATPGSVAPSSFLRVTADQIALVPVAAFRLLPEKVIAALKATQAAGLTAAQVRSLSIAKVKKLSPGAIGEIQPDVLANLSVVKLRALSKAQVKEIWAAQILQLDPAQRKAIRR